MPRRARPASSREELLVAPVRHPLFPATTLVPMTLQHLTEIGPEDVGNSSDGKARNPSGGNYRTANAKDNSHTGALLINAYHSAAKTQA